MSFTRRANIPWIHRNEIAVLKSLSNRLCRFRFLALRFGQLVEVPHVYPQAESERYLGVSRGQLLFVAIEIKIKRVLRVHIQKHHVSVIHGELTKPQLRSPVSHVITSLL